MIIVEKRQEKVRCEPLNRIYKVLIIDAVGLRMTDDGDQDVGEVEAHINFSGGKFHVGAYNELMELEQSKVHFFYQPDLSQKQAILAQTDQGQYDAVIAAATFIPKGCVFVCGGVRIGAGTGNMTSASWGEGGVAPLMSTPSFNSRATAHMVFKAILKVMPNVPVDLLHDKVVRAEFDTTRDLKFYPSEKLEAKKIAILGYGNIGREVAKIAQAFAMQVVIYAKAKHKQWIESEGFEYASSPAVAVKGAAFVSIHLGLGLEDASTGTFSNVGILNDSIFAVMAEQSMLINYDRGELVDIDALDRALNSGKLKCISVDADIFKDEKSAHLSGALLPYYQLQKRYPQQIELLPHVAADTEHNSRVAGAKQAVDQIIRAIRYKELINLKGALPEGYQDVGAYTVSGVGKIRTECLSDMADQELEIEELYATAESLANIWRSVSEIKDLQRRQEALLQHGEQLILASNRYATLMQKQGLSGPYYKGE